MLCSLCLTNSMCWPWRTRVCSTTCCSPPVLKTLLEIAIDRKHLGAEIGVIGILHTWGQNLLLHPHIHCVIPAGGLSPDHRRWIRPRYPYLLTRQGPQPRLSWQVLGWSETSPPSPPTLLR